MGLLRGLFRDLEIGIQHSIARSSERRAEARAKRKQERIRDKGGILMTNDLVITEKMNFTVVEQKFKAAGFTSVHSFGSSGFLPFFQPSNGTVKRIQIDGETPQVNKYYKPNAYVSIEYQYRV